MTFPLIAISIFVSIALFTDLRSRIVPNSLVLTGLVTGLVYQLAYGSILQGLGGLFLAALMTIPFFLMGGFGAGDCKLLMVLGLWTSATFFFGLFAYTAILGAVFSLLVAVLHRTKGKNVLLNTQYFFVHLLSFGKPPAKLALESVTLPYCVPIFFGTAVAIWQAVGQ